MSPEKAYLKCTKENCRIPEFENIIATDPQWSYMYSHDIIQGPFQLGEEAISTNTTWSYCYAREVICGPFEKCHPVIFYSEYKNDYLNFLKAIDYDLNKISEWML